MPSSSRIIKGCNIGSIENKTLEPVVVRPQDSSAEALAKEKPSQPIQDPYLELQKKQVQDLLNQADQARTDVLKKAHQEAEDIKKKAHEEGHAEGLKEGTRLALEERRKENQDYRENLTRAWQSLNQRFLDLEEEYEEEIVMLAVQTAQVFLEETTDTQRLTQQIQKVLQTLVRERNVTVYVHPDQYLTIKEVLGEEENKQPNQLVLAQDPSLAISEFTCETSESCVRFSPKQKLERLLQELLEIHKMGESL